MLVAVSGMTATETNDASARAGLGFGLTVVTAPVWSWPHDLAIGLSRKIDDAA